MNPRAPTSSENGPSPESPCQSLLSCYELISLNPSVSSCLQYEAISYLVLFSLARSLKRKRSPLLVLFSSYIFIVSRIDLTEQSQAVGETKRLSQQRAGRTDGAARLPGASPAASWFCSRVCACPRPLRPMQTSATGRVPL